MSCLSLKSILLGLNTFILVLLLTSQTTICLAQAPNRGHHTTQIAKQAFEVDKPKLNATLKQLEAVLQGKQPLKNIDGLFLSDQEWQSYIANLKTQNYPIREEAIPIFKNFSDQLKTDLQGYYNIVQASQLMHTQTRFGTTPAMKVVSVILNLTLKNGDVVSKRIQLLQYYNTYKLFSINE